MKLGGGSSSVVLCWLEKVSALGFLLQGLLARAKFKLLKTKAHLACLVLRHLADQLAEVFVICLHQKVLFSWVQTA